MSTAHPPVASTLPDDPGGGNVPLVMPRGRARPQPEADNVPVIAPLEGDQEPVLADLAEPEPDAYAIPVEEPEPRLGPFRLVRSVVGWCFGACSPMLAPAVAAA